MMGRLWLSFIILGWTFQGISHIPDDERPNEPSVSPDKGALKDVVEPRANLDRELADQVFFDALERYREAYAKAQREKDGVQNK